jgi:hypothetical protein
MEDMMSVNSSMQVLSECIFPNSSRDKEWARILNRQLGGDPRGQLLLSDSQQNLLPHLKLMLSPPLICVSLLAHLGCINVGLGIL